MKQKHKGKNDARPLLEAVSGPGDLKKLPLKQLEQLAEEIRQLIIKTVSRQGGHLASNLGTVELTLALHTVFDFSRDRLLWDVGHQCYAHKLITGRREKFHKLRQAGGISGFPSPAESDYDLFASGHAGAALSTAAGLAWGDLARGQGDRKVVAVVGDASIVNGASFEAINNAGLLKRQFLIILNDNSMAIDVTQGALARILDRVRLTRTYADLKQRTQRVLRTLPLGQEIAVALRHIKDGLRITMHGEKVFESMGFRYFGPMDGHDIAALQSILQLLGQVNEPVLFHVHTQKGRGCDYAVEDPCRFHSPSAHRVNGSVVEFPVKARPTWTEAFSEALLSRARRDDRIVAMTAAMPDGTGLAAFRDALPERYVDVGISESHAVAMAAGMAKSGLRPVVAIYSTFLQRAFDQICEEIALQGLPVVLCIDRAGLVGSDGAVHHGWLDIAYLRPLPGMVLMSPADGPELGSALDLALSLECPCAIRYPRDEVPENLPGAPGPFKLGKARRVRAGDDGTFLALGAMVEHALTAGEILASQAGIETAVYTARFAKPLDEGLIAELIAAGKPLLVVEDHAATGGFGSAVMELASARSLEAGSVRLLGLPDRYIAFANRPRQLAEVHLDGASLAEAMRRAVVSRSVPHHAE